MSERLKELYKEATGKDWAYDFDPQVAEKFAKLIVRECADIQMKRSCERHGYDKYEDSKKIREHFGVDE